MLAPTRELAQQVQVSELECFFYCCVSCYNNVVKSLWVALKAFMCCQIHVQCTVTIELQPWFSCTFIHVHCISNKCLIKLSICCLL